MNRDDVVRFAHRDWSAVAESKTRVWHEMKSRRSAADVLGLGNQLRLHAQRLKSHWPTLDQRLDDLAVHQRVAEALRAVTCRPR